MNRKICIVTFILLFINSCHPTYHIKITDVSDPSYPCFSISQSRLSPWAKGMWGSLEISEVDSKGNRVKPVWSIEPYQCDLNIKKLCYGKCPVGYKELIKPIPIEMDKFYFINLSYGVYFKIFRNKHDIKVLVYSMSEFYKKVVNNGNSIGRE